MAAYYVFDDGSNLLVIVSQYYPETSLSAAAAGEQQPTHLPQRPDYLQFVADTVSKPKDVLTYVCGVMDLCFNHYARTRDVLLGPRLKENQCSVRVWLEHIFQDQDGDPSPASDLVEDIEGAVKGLFEASCSLYWVPARSFDNVVCQSSTSNTGNVSVQLVESPSPDLASKIYDIARQSSIEQAPVPDEKDSEPPEAGPLETRPTEMGALDTLVWHMLVVEPNSDATLRLGDIQMAAGALRNYSIALDSVVKLVPPENLSPSTVLCEYYYLEFD